MNRHRRQQIYVRDTCDSNRHWPAEPMIGEPRQEAVGKKVPSKKV